MNLIIVLGIGHAISGLNGDIRIGSGIEFVSNRSTVHPDRRNCHNWPTFLNVDAEIIPMLQLDKSIINDDVSDIKFGRRTDAVQFSIDNSTKIRQANVCHLTIHSLLNRYSDASCNLLTNLLVTLQSSLSSWITSPMLFSLRFNAINLRFQLH